MKPENMEVREVLTGKDIANLLLIINENDHSEHDCDREVYIKHVIKNMYANPAHRITLLCLGAEIIGYLIVRFDNFMKKELVVLDVFIKQGYQGKKYLDVLLADMVPVAFKIGALRVKWPSYVFDTDFWTKHAFGCDVKSYKVFYVELTDDSKETFEEVTS